MVNSNPSKININILKNFIPAICFETVAIFKMSESLSADKIIY